MGQRRKRLEVNKLVKMFSPIGEVLGPVECTKAFKKKFIPKNSITPSYKF